jgi:hypothetical protein
MILKSMKSDDLVNGNFDLGVRDSGLGIWKLGYKKRSSNHLL